MIGKFNSLEVRNMQLIDFEKFDVSLDLKDIQVNWEDKNDSEEKKSYANKNVDDDLS